MVVVIIVGVEPFTLRGICYPSIYLPLWQHCFRAEWTPSHRGQPPPVASQVLKVKADPLLEEHASRAPPRLPNEACRRRLITPKCPFPIHLPHTKSLWVNIFLFLFSLSLSTSSRRTSFEGRNWKGPRWKERLKPHLLQRQ